MKNWKIKLIALAFILSFCLLVDLKLRSYSSERKLDDGSIAISCIGKITDIDAGMATGEPSAWVYPVDGQIITLKIMSGRYKGKEIFAPNPLTGEYNDRILKIGDRLYANITLKNINSPNISSANVGEYVRTPFLLYLAGIFTGLVVIIGGAKGVRTVMTLLISGVFVVSFLIPGCLKGYNPIWLAILISTINTALTFMLVSGLSMKSLAGSLGTVGGLLTTSLLAYIFVNLLRFTGLDINFGFLTLGKLLWMSKDSTGWNFSGLLTAGMILGASGAMMDASMAVASAIDEVKRANPRTGVRGCIRAGLNVGKDEMGMMANTLIFAYIGADMTLILMPMIQFGEAGRAMPLTRVINEEAASAEIVQALAGTIGLIMAIPITAIIAGFLIGRRFTEEMIVHDIPEIQMPITIRQRSISSFVLPVALLIILIAIHITYIASRSSSASQIDKSEKNNVAEYVRARVLEKSSPLDISGTDALGLGTAKNEILKVGLLGGNFKSKQGLVQNIIDPNRAPLYNVEVNTGTEVLLKVDGNKDGIGRILMINYSRDGYLIYLTGLFVLLMAIVGRFQGIRTAIALGIAIALVMKVMIPFIVSGYNAIIVVICVSGLIASSSLIIVTGFNRKSGAATIGILGGVVAASLIVLYADQKLHFTGISSSRTAIVSQFTGSEKLDFRKILMAGIIMGLLGTAMDAAMAISSAIREIRRADPKMPTIELIASGMNVGTDLLGTMSNTLIFAYLGLRIILLMTFAGTSIFSGSKIEILSAETISAEILRLLAGSIGLVLTIPITAIVAASWDRILGLMGFGRIPR